MASITYTDIESRGTFRAGWERFKRNFMIARMETVLSQFGDAELRQMGITRADIPARAQALVDGQY